VLQYIFFSLVSQVVFKENVRNVMKCLVVISETKSVTKHHMLLVLFTFFIYLLET